MWFILKIKTVFDRISAISNSFGEKNSFQGSSLLISEIVSFMTEMRVFLSRGDSTSNLRKFEHIFVAVITYIYIYIPACCLLCALR